MCGLGIIFYFTGLTLGGWLQGSEMNRKETRFLEIAALTLPYLKSRTWAGSMMTPGHVFFAISFVWMLLSKQSARTTATLLGKPLAASPKYSMSMNRFRIIFTGFLLTFFSSWVGLVLLPIITVGDFKQTVDPATEAKMPPDLTAPERRG